MIYLLQNKAEMMAFITEYNRMPIFLKPPVYVQIREMGEVYHFFQANSPSLPENFPSIAVKYNIVRFIQRTYPHLTEEKILSWGEKDLHYMVDDVRHVVEKERATKHLRAERNRLKNLEWVRGDRKDER